MHNAIDIENIDYSGDVEIVEECQRSLRGVCYGISGDGVFVKIKEHTFVFSRETGHCTEWPTMYGQAKGWRIALCEMPRFLGETYQLKQKLAKLRGEKVAQNGDANTSSH